MTEKLPCGHSLFDLVYSCSKCNSSSRDEVTHLTLELNELREVRGRLESIGAESLREVVRLRGEVALLIRERDAARQRVDGRMAAYTQQLRFIDKCTCGHLREDHDFVNHGGECSEVCSCDKFMLLAGPSDAVERNEEL